MKKNLLIFFLLFQTLQSSAQVFAPVGATWYYNFGSWGFPYTNYPVLIESVADTIINGISCRKVQTPLGCGVNSEYFFYNNGDTVYNYVGTLNQFKIFYNFSAQPGDTLKIYSDFASSGVDSCYVTVDSVSTILINGFTRKILYMSEAYPSYDPFSYIQLFGNWIEGIGNVDFLVPQIGVCDPQTGPLRCYEDSIIGLYSTGLAPTCDTIFTVGIKNLFAENNFTISPNPVIDFLNVTYANQTQNGFYEICDAMGRCIRQSKLISNKIEVQHLSPALYFLRVKDGDNVYSSKFIKQ